MAENKTKPTDASVADHLAARADEQQLADCRRLIAMFTKLTRKRPKMWGPSIVGHGSQRYTYASGRSGEMPLAAFAIRGRELVVYLTPGARGQQALLAKLGKHRMTKCCLYIRHLADLDVSILKRLVTGSIAETRRLHGRPHRT